MIADMVLLFDRGPAALRLKSVCVLGDGGSVRRGRPGTAALRLKSVCVLGDGGSVGRGRSGDGRAPNEELSCVWGWCFCSKGAAEDCLAPTEELSCVGDGASVRRGRPGTAALRLKSVRVLGMVLLFDGGGRGRPRSY